MDFANLRTLLFRWLPFFLIGMIILGIALFAMRTVLPRWQNYSTLESQVGAQRALVATQLADQLNNDNLTILQQQIDSVNGKLDDAGEIFLLPADADQVLNRLYNYAYSRGVRVINLQASALPTAQANSNRRGETPSVSESPYNSVLFQVQASGGVANLIDFMSHFHEASLPAVNIVSLSVRQDEGGGRDRNAQATAGQAVLTMALQVYTSPYASGDALNSIPTSTPTIPATLTLTPSVTPTPTLTLTPSETPVTPVPTVEPTRTIPPSPTNTNTVAPTSTFTPVPSNTITPTLAPADASSATPAETPVNCPGALPTLFQVGDVAVVSFSGIGALRVLSDPNGGVSNTRTQAYDNNQLEIVAGPVCANGSLYWYIRNVSLGDALGWVAEGQGEQRWLCTVAAPDCGSE